VVEQYTEAEGILLLYTFFQTRLFSPGFHRLLIVIVVNARSLSSFTFSDTFANSIADSTLFLPTLTLCLRLKLARFLPEIKVGTISARD
jgi:hypothetical protein